VNSYRNGARSESSTKGYGVQQARRLHSLVECSDIVLLLSHRSGPAFCSRRSYIGRRSVDAPETANAGPNMSIMTCWTNAPVNSAMQIRPNDPRRSSGSGYRSQTYPKMTSNASPSQSPDRAALLRAANIALGTEDVEVDRLEGYLYRTYRLRARNGSFCVMRCRPLQSIRLLHLEDNRLATEAAMLSLLHRCKHPSAPRLLDDQRANRTASTAFLIAGPFSGTVLGHMDRPLSASRRRTLDHSHGQYIRRLSSIKGQSFGLLSTLGMPTWSLCFASLLQFVLYDAEDSLVSLPYSAIRDQVRRHRPSLDKITEPRLTLLEAADEDNFVFDTRTDQLTSLLDYGTAIWGDPFFCDSFYTPSEAFVEGYGEDIGGDADQRIRHLL